MAVLPVTVVLAWRCVPLRLALVATWRITLPLVILLGVTVLPVALCMQVVVGHEFALPALVFVVIFPASIVAHEWAHAACAWRWPGSRRSARVFSLLAGPAAGAACALPLVVVPVFGAPPLECAVLVVPFLGHLLALAPVAADGRAILAAVEKP